MCLAAVIPAFTAQEQEPQGDGPIEFVSGNVVELSANQIVVNRAVLGKPAENRTFTISGETKVEGQLKVGVRVTVGYRNGDGGDPVAVRIIVRQNPAKKR